MADPADQARKFQDFNQQFLDDLSQRAEAASESHIRFQKAIAQQWSQTLAKGTECLDDASFSEAAKSMMACCLSAAAFQREQMKILLDTQIAWNQMYLKFLDGLETKQPASDAPR